MDRLQPLKLLLGIEGNEQDALLELILDKAEDFICHYCHVEQISTEMAYLLLDIAVFYYNRLGTEGENSRTEGGVRRDFGGSEQDMPQSIRRSLAAFTRVTSLLEV